MLTVEKIYDKIEKLIPKALSDEYVKKYDAYDNHGIIVGNADLNVSKIMLCLDVTDDIINECIEQKVQLIISHHPLVFYPINNISTTDILSKKVVKLIENKIALISLHLSLDIVEGGVNSALGSSFNGEIIDRIEKLDSDFGLGEIKRLEKESSFLELVNKCQNEFKYESVRWYGKERKVKNIAYIGGAGSLNKQDKDTLKAQNVDVYITGEMRHHEILDCLENGFNLILLGHFNSEVVVLNNLQSMLKSIIDENIEILISKKLALN